MSDVYLVDDHALVRDGLKVVLEMGGHRVVGQSGDVVTAASEIPRVGPGVVLVDLNLGEGSGLDLLEALLPRMPLTRFMVLSMLAEPRHVVHSLRIGARGYLLKGSPAAELLQAVECVARGDLYLGPGVQELSERALTEAIPRQHLNTLSVRERQIIALVVRGRSSSQIGALLNLSPKTVDTYRSRIMAKLGVSDVPALVRLAIREGLLSVEEP